MFTRCKCPVCHNWIEKHKKDFCYATVSSGKVLRVDPRAPTECAAGDKVYELHERCGEAFVLAPPS